MFCCSLFLSFWILLFSVIFFFPTCLAKHYPLIFSNSFGQPLCSVSSDTLCQIVQPVVVFPSSFGHPPCSLSSDALCQIVQPVSGIFQLIWPASSLFCDHWYPVMPDSSLSKLTWSYLDMLPCNKSTFLTAHELILLTLMDHTVEKLSGVWWLWVMHDALG